VILSRVSHRQNPLEPQDNGYCDGLLPVEEKTAIRCFYEVFFLQVNFAESI
jgi:hypothetical protein